MKIECLILSVFVVGACKTRDPEEPGLIEGAGDEGAALTEEAPSEAAGGQWKLTCRRTDDVATTYELDVKGAVDPKDETQPIVVSVRKVEGSSSSPLAESVSGRGAIAADGPVFVGFESGVLTAELDPAKTSGSTHVGVITLANDAEANGVGVGCDVVRR